MSDVPLPDPDDQLYKGSIPPTPVWFPASVKDYGDARAAEARRLALLEAAELCAKIYDEGQAACRFYSAKHAADRLRDLASRESVSKRG